MEVATPIDTQVHVSPFFWLPRELRDMVYAFCWMSQAYTFLDSGLNLPTSTILCLNRQISQEATEERWRGCEINVRIGKLRVMEALNMVIHLGTRMARAEPLLGILEYVLKFRNICLSTQLMETESDFEGLYALYCAAPQVHAFISLWSEYQGEGRRRLIINLQDIQSRTILDPELVPRARYGWASLMRGTTTKATCEVLDVIDFWCDKRLNIQFRLFLEWTGGDTWMHPTLISNYVAVPKGSRAFNDFYWANEALHEPSRVKLTAPEEYLQLVWSVCEKDIEFRLLADIDDNEKRKICLKEVKIRWACNGPRGARFAIHLGGAINN